MTVPEALGVYGAVLSTALAAPQALKAWHRLRPLSVRATVQDTLDNKLNDVFLYSGLVVKVANRGEMPEDVAAVGVFGRTVRAACHPIGSDLPVTLEPGEILRLYFSEDEVPCPLADIRGIWVRDDQGKQYESRFNPRRARHIVYEGF